MCRFVYTKSLKYHLVVMLDARIDVVEATIWNFNAYLLPLSDQKRWQQWLNKIKRDRTHHKKCSRLQRTLLIRKGSIKYSILVLLARLKSFCTPQICCVWNNVCVHVCKTTNWQFICLIICNCINIVVINCGWNNIVAVKIVAWWHWNIYIFMSR